MFSNCFGSVIVPVDPRLRDLAGLRTRFPGVRFVEAGGERTCAELRSLGVRSAAGRVIEVGEGVTEFRAGIAADRR